MNVDHVALGDCMAGILSMASMKLHAHFTRTIFAASELLVPVRKWGLLDDQCWIFACR